MIKTILILGKSNSIIYQLFQILKKIKNLIYNLDMTATRMLERYI